MREWTCVAFFSVLRSPSPPPPPPPPVPGPDTNPQPGAIVAGPKHCLSISGNLAPLAQAHELARRRHLRAHVDVGHFRAVDIARRVHSNRVQRLDRPPIFRSKSPGQETWRRTHNEFVRPLPGRRAAQRLHALAGGAVENADATPDVWRPRFEVVPILVPAAAAAREFLTCKARPQPWTRRAGAKVRTRQTPSAVPAPPRTRAPPSLHAPRTDPRADAPPASCPAARRPSCTPRRESSLDPRRVLSRRQA